jgi:glutaconyl-CoA/methylmalonyl-CoA decarboxylase subunit gamma
MKKLRITIGKKTYDVTVEVLDEGVPPTVRPRQGPTVASNPSTPERGSSAPVAASAAGLGSVMAPMAGVIKSISVKEGDTVERGAELMILEAMKMENQITAREPGSVKSVDVAEGESVTEGQILLVLE